MDLGEPIFINKSGKKPKEGDIFVIQIFPDCYFYGKVILSNIVSSNIMMNGMWLVYIYGVVTKGIDIDVELTPQKLLFAPLVINKLGWSRGFLYTIDNQPVTNEELIVDYGFIEYDFIGEAMKGNFKVSTPEDMAKIPRKYVGVSGTDLDHIPRYYGTNGVGNHFSIYHKICMAIKENILMMSPYFDNLSPEEIEKWKEYPDSFIEPETNRNEEKDKFLKKIKPFEWNEDEGNISLLLNTGGYRQNLFDSLSEKGYSGNGYEWESLAQMFIKENMPEVLDSIQFDSEAGLFCLHSNNNRAIKKFALAFSNFCENEKELLRLLNDIVI